jgi:hypothetical protein
MFLSILGQAETMRSSYAALLGGLLGAIVLVHALIVVNFQSWLDPFIIITALPAALAGIILMLFLTHTTLSVPCKPAQSVMPLMEGTSIVKCLAENAHPARKWNPRILTCEASNSG